MTRGQRSPADRHSGERPIQPRQVVQIAEAQFLALEPRELAVTSIGLRRGTENQQLYAELDLRSHLRDSTDAARRLSLAGFDTWPDG